MHHHHLCHRPLPSPCHPPTHPTHGTHPTPPPQVCEEYLESLLLLDRKLSFMGSDAAAQGSAAARDVEGLLDKLRLRAIAKVCARGARVRCTRLLMQCVLQLVRAATTLASLSPSLPPPPPPLLSCPPLSLPPPLCSLPLTLTPPLTHSTHTHTHKVRDFLLAKLYQLRKPKTNISIIQQNVLLKHKYFVRFLAQHGPEVHAEVRRAQAGSAPAQRARSAAQHLAAPQLAS